MSARMSAYTAVVAGALVVLAAGCKKSSPTPAENPDDTSLLAQDGADTSAVESDHQLLASSLVSATATGGTLTLASSAELAGAQLTPADLGDAAKAFYFPRGCLTTAHDPATRTVTYDFADCTGPNGLVRIQGEVKATYDVQPGQLTLELVGTALRINKATADWHATTVITAAGVARTMTWKGQLSGTTARGRDFSRTTDKTVSWRLGERCFTVSGTSEGNVKGRNLRTEITTFSRCQGGCPEAGGAIAITNLGTGTKVSIAFDGTDHATVTGPKGDTLSVPLACVP